MAATKAKPQAQQQIVIVGGGMVGISQALLLAKHLSAAIEAGKVTLTLVERFAMSAGVNSTNINSAKQPPSFDARSTALSAGSVDILKAIDCWDRVVEAAEPINRVHVSDRGHFGGLQLQADDFSLPALGYVTENRALGQVLKQSLKASAVRFLAPAEVTDCLPCRQGYRLQLLVDGQQQNLDANLLIVADGSESPLSKGLGIATHISDYGQTALIANVALSKPHGGIAYERFTDTGPMALLPLSPIGHEERAALVWTLPNDYVVDIKTADDKALLARLQSAFGYRCGVIKRIGECHYYPLKLSKACEQVRSSLVLIGNAAHFLHPVAGQGFNLALRDCQVLSLCLAQAYEQGLRLGALPVLQDYLERQGPDQQVTMSMTHHMVNWFSSNQQSKAVLRQLALLGMNKLPPLKRAFGRQMMGLEAGLW